MKKIIPFILIISSIAMLAIAYYFYNSNDINERKSRLMNHMKAELLHRSLPNNQFDKDLAQEEYILNKFNIEVSLEQRIAISECVYNADPNFYKEEAIACAKELNSNIIQDLGEETLIKSIANSYFNNDDTPLIIGGFLMIEGLQEKKEDRWSQYLKFISYSGFLYDLRDPEKLSAFYKKYQSLMHNYITYDIYKKHLQGSIDNLLKGYQILNNMPDRAAFLKEVEARGEKNYNHSDSENWRITFWERRALEKNDKIIYSILKKIKKHYEEQ